MYSYQFIVILANYPSGPSSYGLVLELEPSFISKIGLNWIQVKRGIGYHTKLEPPLVLVAKKM
jgi:hypothetical protein